jgi:cytochrome P450
MPERFLGASPSNYTWIPFGGGVRRCVAAQFAQLEMKRVIQTVLSEVDLGPASDPRSRQRATRSSVAFAPGEARAVVIRRGPAHGRRGRPASRGWRSPVPG